MGLRSVLDERRLSTATTPMLYRRLDPSTLSAIPCAFISLTAFQLAGRMKEAA